MLTIFERDLFGNPWCGARRLRLEMDRLFRGHVVPPAETFPPVNVRTDEDGAIVTAELPGVEPEALDITTKGQALTIRGKRESEEAGEGATWYRHERACGSFVREIELPFAIDQDHVEATCRDGILDVRLQRCEADKPKKIAVKS